MPRRGVRALNGRTMMATMKLIVKRCQMYAKAKDAEEKRLLMLDVWRYANIALVQGRRKQVARKKRKAKKPDGRLREPVTRYGFKCEAAEFNGSQCAVQCSRCKAGRALSASDVK